MPVISSHHSSRTSPLRVFTMGKSGVIAHGFTSGKRLTELKRRASRESVEMRNECQAKGTNRDHIFGMAVKPQDISERAVDARCGVQRRCCHLLLFERP